MRVSTTLVVLAGFLHQILAAPSLAETDKRGTFTPPMLARIYIQFDDGPALQNRCNGDNLYNSFIDRRFSASASAFCSSYIRPTVTATTTVT